MLRRSNSAQPPEMMTWGKAAPVLSLSVVFDALRFMCAQLWLFGPALAAAYCTMEGGAFLEKWTFGVLGTGTAGVACSAASGALGYYAAPLIAMLGVVLAMAVGFLGWLTIGLILLMTNERVFKENSQNTLWLVVSLFIGEIPFVGSLPAFTATTWKIYHAQIKADKEAMKKYEKETAGTQLQERRERAAELMRARSLQIQIAEANAADETQRNERADEEEIPYGLRKAA